jgi:aminoglycoside N3'-acetyltransferase
MDVNEIAQLGVRRGGVLLVHASFRAIRPFDGGPSKVIGALRDAVGDEGTLVMPAWGDDDDVPYDSGTTPVSDSLGVIAQTFARMPGVERSTQPFAFAAQGPHAAAILRDPFPRPPHGRESPVGRVHELDGQILLLGVGHDANTTVHLAESFAQVPYGVEKHCTVMVDGRATRVDYVETDHCCAGFARMDAWLRERGLQREGTVAHGRARLMEARSVVSVACEHLAVDPLVFLCGENSGCGECGVARASIANGSR